MGSLRPWGNAIRPVDVPADAVVRVLRVPPELAGTRIDVFLTSQLRNTSRTRAKLIAEKAVYSLDGKKRRANDRVLADERLAVWRIPPDESDHAVDLPALYE